MELIIPLRATFASAGVAIAPEALPEFVGCMFRKSSHDVSENAPITTNTIA
jgi:hypothetical protein